MLLLKTPEPKDVNGLNGSSNIQPLSRDARTRHSFNSWHGYTPTPLMDSPAGRAWSKANAQKGPTSPMHNRTRPSTASAKLLSPMSNGNAEPSSRKVSPRDRVVFRAKSIDETESHISMLNDSLGDADLLGPKVLRLPERPRTAHGSMTSFHTTAHSTLDSRNTPRSFESSGTLARNGFRSKPRQIISSWTPSNATLHWHAGLNDQDLDALPDWLWSRKNLRVLQIRKNRLKALPESIMCLKNLNELLADHNEIKTLPKELYTLTVLQKLDLSHNYVTSVSSDLSCLCQLREFKISNNKLTSLPKGLVHERAMLHLRVLDISFNRIRSLPSNIDQLEMLEILNASYNILEAIPSHIRCLEFLTHLDVSYNHLVELPIGDLVVLLGQEHKDSEPCLKSVECAGNPALVRPPNEIAEQGGASVAMYLKATAEKGDSELPNTELVLVVIGEDKAGKTSMIDALMSTENIAIPETDRDPHAGMEFMMWAPDDDLTFQILDIPGEYVYNTTHMLFLMRRAVYIFVWSYRKTLPGEELPEWEVLEQERMVHRWIDSLQHRVPGASLILVVTRTDMATSKADLDRQCRMVQNAVKTRLDFHRQGRPESSFEVASQMIQVLNGGDSLRVDNLSGEGINLLRKELVAFAKKTKWYREMIPAPYLRLRDRVLKMVRQGETDWLTWSEFMAEADECGVQRTNHLRIATMFLHDMGMIRYFGEVDEAREASEAKLQENAMMDTVFINLSWMVEVVQGLMKADRGLLIDFFGKGICADKIMAFRLRRLITHGFLHPSLFPFLWPRVESWPSVSSKSINRYWDRVSNGGEEYMKMMVQTEDSLVRAVQLLEGLDIIAVSEELTPDSVQASFVVPGLLATSHRFRVDSRVFGDECLFKCIYDFVSLPPGFFERFIVRMRRHATHMDFNAYSAAFYRTGTKLQVFVNRDKDNQHNATGLTALFSSSKLWKKFKAELLHIGKFFPGLQTTAFEFEIASNVQNRRDLLTKRQSSGSVRWMRKESMFDSVTPQNTAALIEDKVRQFEKQLKVTPDPVQVVISHSPAASDLAQQMAQSLNTIDSEISVEVLNPNEAADCENLGGRVMVICMDNDYHKNSQCLKTFKTHVDANQMVIPLILPGYKFKDVSRWWPVNMQEMRQFSLFVDIRGDEWLDMKWKNDLKEYYSTRRDLVVQLRKLASTGDPWASQQLALAEGTAQDADKHKREKTCRALHADIKKILEEWRGDAPHGSAQVSDHIACIECTSNGSQRPETFNRADCVGAMDQWRDQVLISRQRNEAQPLAPIMTCGKGHKLPVEKILSSAVIHDSVPCPSCWEHNIQPPWSFSRQTLLSVFDESNTQRMGVMTCPKCSGHGLPALRILDILAPEVFLSYNWGVPIPQEDGSMKFSSQEIVKQFRKQVEIHADVLCWLDVEGGLSAGQDHLKQIADGMQKAYVTVIFLSDQYVNSDNCKREFFLAVHGGNFIIPVLVPPHETESGEVLTKGWSGPGQGDPQWWAHAVRICKQPSTDLGEIDWAVLADYDPVDMRAMGGDLQRAQAEVIKQILKRFHRVNQYKLEISRAQKKWRKLRLVHTFSLLPRGKSGNLQTGGFGSPLSTLTSIREPPKPAPDHTRHLSICSDEGIHAIREHHHVDGHGRGHPDPHGIEALVHNLHSEAQNGITRRGSDVTDEHHAFTRHMSLDGDKMPMQEELEEFVHHIKADQAQITKAVEQLDENVAKKPGGLVKRVRQDVEQGRISPR